MKKTLHSTLILSILLISFSSCNDESSRPDVIQLLINSSSEAGSQSPNKWYANSGSYLTEWSSDHSFTGSKSLMISSDNDVGNFGYWTQSVRNDIPHGRRLRLSCMIKLDNVDPNSEGVSIAIRGDGDDNKSVFFYTTQGDIPIRGNHDWEKYSIDMKSEIPETVNSLLVFLILLNDTYGTVYFDDIALETIN